MADTKREDSKAILKSFKAMRWMRGEGGGAAAVDSGYTSGNYRLDELEVVWLPWKRQSPPIELSS